eukprot:gene8198-26_t
MSFFRKRFQSVSVEYNYGSSNSQSAEEIIDAFGDKNNYVKICYEVQITNIEAEFFFPDNEINPTLKFILDEPESTKKSTKVIKECAKPRWKDFFNFECTFLKGTNLLITAFNDNLLVSSAKISLLDFPVGDSKRFDVDIYNLKKTTEKIGSVSFEGQIERTRKAELIAHWNFKGNFRRNGFVTDVTPYGMTAFCKALDEDVNDVEVVPGMKKGYQAGRFNGLNYLECNHNPLEGFPEFTIVIWFYLEDWRLDYPLVSTFETNSKNKKEGYSILGLNSKFYDTKQNAIELDHSDEIEKEFLYQDVFNLKDWNSKIITYSGAEMKEYINGICVNTLKMNREILTSGKKFVIGAIADDLDFRGLKGKICEVKLYNHVVSPQDAIVE